MIVFRRRITRYGVNPHHPMKCTSTRLLAAGVPTLGLLTFLAGCSSTPTREATTEMSASASIASNVRPPVPIRTVDPEYPWQMTRSGISGTVDLHCLIDASGRVQDIKVASASNEQFIPPTLAAIKQWTFNPGMHEGVPVPMQVSVPVRFLIKP